MIKVSYLTALICLLALGGCDHRAEDEAQSYAALEAAGGTAAALCQAAQSVESEWRKRGNTSQIDHWETMRKLKCENAAICASIVGGCQ